MALFFQQIVYRSPLSSEKILERVENAIRKKGVFSFEYWTLPAKYFRGKVCDNGFRLSSIGRNQWLEPSVDGTVENTESGSVINVKIIFPHLAFTIFFLLTGATIFFIFGFITGKGWPGLTCYHLALLHYFTCYFALFHINGIVTPVKYGLRKFLRRREKINEPLTNKINTGRSFLTNIRKEYL